MTQHVGLYGRQANIAELEIPRWATIHLDCRIGDLIHSMTRIRDLLQDLAVVGVEGATVVVYATPSEWTQHDLSSLLSGLDAKAVTARPYFRTVIANDTRIAEDREGLVVGKQIVLCDLARSERISLPAGPAYYVLDEMTSMVGCASDPMAMVTEARASVAGTPQAHPAKEPNWNAASTSQGVLFRLCSVMLINAVCKRERMAGDTFFFVSELADSMVARIITERGIRPRLAPVPAPASQPEAVPENSGEPA